MATEIVTPADPLHQRVSSIDEVVAYLRTIAALDGLTEEEFRWLAHHSVEAYYSNGQHVFAAGEPADYMAILLTGEIHVRRPGSSPVSYLIGRAGNLTGKLPYSRMQAWGGNGFAAGNVHALRVHESQFPAMLQAIPSMGQRCVTILLDRVREVTRMEQQAEKLDALGKLAANLSHELNNPASAARSAAATLFQELRTYGDQKFRLGSLCLNDEDTQHYRQWVHSVLPKLHDESLRHNDSLDAAEREEEFIAWLTQHDVPDAWKWAPALAVSAMTLDDLNHFAALARPEVLSVALPAFVSGMRAERMSNTIVEATARIFDFITAIQDYSYMDQAPIQEIDAAQSLETVLTMFASRLNGIHIKREIAPVLPPLSVYGSEINQVWSELIENALDSMNGDGTLTLRVKVSGPVLFVEICDSGPGIPESIRSRIFEPFFSTKSNGGIGTGMGLGLDNANRIVLKHRGQLSVVSEPGNTCFQVRLPIENIGAY